jgi:tetratricopeptide (TPR) repeat protein
MKRKLRVGVLLTALSLLNINLMAQDLNEAIKMYKYGRYESAKNMLKPLSASDATANYYLGLCELENENRNGAKEIFLKFPEDAANTAGLARVFIQEEKVPEAMSLLNKITAKVKKKEWLPYKYAADAITYTDGADPNTAVQWYQKAMEITKNGDLYASLGDVYRKIQGGGGNAMNNYEYAETFPEVQSLANYKMGNLWYAAKNYDSALSKYGRASELDQNNPLPFKALADAYYKVGKYKISKEKIEKYLELSDKTADDQIQYANTLYLAKEYPAAISKMNELISKGIEKPYMYRVIGFSQYETKDFVGAKENMEKLFAKQDPKKIIPQDYMYYGKILLKDTSNSALAQSNFLKSIEIDTAKDKTSRYREIAEAFNDVQKYAYSADWYKKIVDANMPSIEPTDYWWSGVMYFYAKDFANAEPMLKTMSEKYPNEPSSYFWLARTTVASKDKEYKNGEASALFNQWLGMIKTDDPARKNDLIKAYTYFATVAYNNGKKDEAKQYCDKLTALDPNDNTAKQILKGLESLK